MHTDQTSRHLMLCDCTGKAHKQLSPPLTKHPFRSLRQARGAAASVTPRLYGKLPIQRRLLSYVCMYIYIYIYIHTYLHTYIPTYLHTYIHTYIPTYLPTYLPTYIHTYIHNNNYIQSYIHTVIHGKLPVQRRLLSSRERLADYG